MALIWRETLFHRAESEVRVLVAIGRRAAAEQPHPGRACLQLVPGAGWNQDCVALLDLARFSVDLHRPATRDEEVDLLAQRVVVALRRLPRVECRLGQGL